jgi:hypothetical protein
MFNNQLKNIKKKIFSWEKKHIWKKKISIVFCRVVRVTNQPDFVEFLLILILYLTWTSPATKSTHHANSSLVPMLDSVPQPQFF